MMGFKTYLIKYMEKSNKILTTLKEMFPNAGCELIYNNLFELLIAVSLSAQTTDKRVNEVTKELFQKFPTPYDLYKANYNDVYTIILPLGLAKQKTKNIILLSKKLIDEFNGNVPSTINELVKLPGVGRKTASVILMEGFSIPTIPVDTHVLRVSNRLGLVNSEDVRVVENELEKQFTQDNWYYVHHCLLFFGRYLCKAKNPECNRCPFQNLCIKNDKKPPMNLR